MSDQGDDGPLELMIYHQQSGIVIRPDWSEPLLFERSWHATMFIAGSQKPPLGCDWIKVFYKKNIINIGTLSDLFHKVFRCNPLIDAMDRESRQTSHDRLVKNALLEI
jgi:hypothetical protein